MAWGEVGERILPPTQIINEGAHVLLQLGALRNDLLRLGGRDRDDEQRQQRAHDGEHLFGE